MAEKRTNFCPGCMSRRALAHLESLERSVEERLSREQQRDISPCANPAPAPPPNPTSNPCNPATGAPAHRMATSFQKKVEEAVYRHVSPERE